MILSFRIRYRQGLFFFNLHLFLTSLYDIVTKNDRNTFIHALKIITRIKFKIQTELQRKFSQMLQLQYENINESSQYSSTASQVLVNLQKKIQKYLSPSYDSCQNVFQKSKQIKKLHEQAISNNKYFEKKNANDQFLKQEARNGASQLDQLLHRRKKCEAKLHQMLFDHQFEKTLRAQCTQTPQQVAKASFRPFSNDFISDTSLKQVKSQPVLPLNSLNSEPNFLKVQKQLQTMQKKLQKLYKKVNNTKSSKKSHKNENQTKSRISEFVNGPSNKKFITKTKSSQNLKKKEKGYPVKTNSLQKQNEKSSIHKKKIRQNSQEISSIKKNDRPSCVSNDQISIVAKLKSNLKAQNPSQKNLKGSKLKKVGFSKFNEASKKVLEQNQSKKTKDKILDQNKPNSKTNINSLARSQNRIKVNLAQCQSEQVL